MSLPFKGVGAFFALSLLSLASVPSAFAIPRTVLTLTQSGDQINLYAEIGRPPWRFLRGQNGRAVVRISYRGPAAWDVIKRERFERRRLSASYPLRHICGGQTYGKRPVAAQIGLRLGRFWRNRATRSWQPDFVAYQTTRIIVHCGPLPGDMPPGTLSMPLPTGPTHWAMPSEDGNPPPPVAPPPVAPPPVEPPPPPAAPLIVPRDTFENFYTTLRNERFDSGRYNVLHDWASRLGDLRLTPGQIIRILTVFSFDSDRLRAARRLAIVALRPLRAGQVAAIIQTFRMDSVKQDAAFAYCRGLADPLNVGQITSRFAFESSRRRILAVCR